MAYLFIATLLSNQPALPLVPGISSADRQQAIHGLLQFRWGRVHRALASAIGISKALQGCSI